MLILDVNCRPSQVKNYQSIRKQVTCSFIIIPQIHYFERYLQDDTDKLYEAEAKILLKNKRRKKTNKREYIP